MLFPFFRPVYDAKITLYFTVTRHFLVKFRSKKRTKATGSVFLNECHWEGETGDMRLGDKLRTYTENRTLFR